MNLPSLTSVKNQSVDTLARIGGATVGKMALGAIKKSGFIYSLILFVGGLMIAITGPDKFKLKEMGEGLAMYGGLKLIGDLAQPEINWGLGSATPSAMAGIALPEQIRNAISQYVPSIDGLGITVYPAGTKIAAEDTSYKVLNGAPIPLPNASNHMEQPARINVPGVGVVPVISA